MSPFFFVALAFCACSDEKKTDSTSATDYFPTHDFFQAEVERLSAASPAVHKTVGKNGDTEVKDVAISNWENELGAFLSVDLNKPALKDAFEVDSSERSIRYTAKDPELEIQSVLIVLDTTQRPQRIEISKQSDNILYQNKEELKYITDSSYQLIKEQDILFLGKNNYQITGQFSKID